VDQVDGRFVLRASRCPGCARTYFPARGFCPVCRRPELSPAALSGGGVVHTFSVIHQSTPEFPVPYTVAYADLDEGIRLLGQLHGCRPEEVRVGMPIEVVPAETGRDPEGRTIVTYRFRPAGTAGA
jgi:uncharacterized OB-fold protein